MKPSPEQEELLHHLLDKAGNQGPSAEVVLQWVRSERARRRQRRTMLTAGAGLLVAMASVGLWWQAQRFPQTTTRTSPEPIVVRRIDDEEFLKLLAQQDQPVALVKLPNGEQKLLLLAESGAVSSAN